MARRSIVWVKPDPIGAEFADVDISRGRLTATGTAVGSSPLGYRLDYKLETLAGYRADAFVVVAYGRILSPALLAVPPLGPWNGSFVVSKTGRYRSSVARTTSCSSRCCRR